MSVCALNKDFFIRTTFKKIILNNQMMIMLKHNQHYLMNVPLCSSGNYNSIIAAKLNLTLIV